MQKTFAALPAVEKAPAKARWYCRHPVLGSMAALLVCWSPFLIAFFPGSVCWDLGEMAAQYFGLRQINTWHPVFLTGLYGALLSFGRLFSSDNLGTALYMLLQTLALSYAFARTMELLRRWGLPRWFWLAALGFFGLTPLFGGYAQSICKDTFYTAFLLLFALNAMEVLAGWEQGKSPSPAALAGLFGWGLLEPVWFAPTGCMWCSLRGFCCWPWGRRARLVCRWPRRWAAAWPALCWFPTC